MRKWEYLLVQQARDTDNPLRDGPQVYTTYRGDTGAPGVVSANTMLRELGRAGWELVSVTGGGNWVFKREGT